MRLRFSSLLTGVLAIAVSVAAHAAAQKPTSYPPESSAAPASSPSSSTQFSNAPSSAIEKQAEEYYDYTMAHIYQEEYETTSIVEDATKAIDLYQKAYQLDPNSAVIGEQLARIYFESNRVPEAITEARKIIARDPSNLPARRLLARIYLRSLADLTDADEQTRMAELAIEQLKQVVRLDPTDTGAALWLARLDRLTNQPDDAQAVLQAVMKQDPNNEEAAVQLSRLLLDENKGSEAVTLLQGIIARAPTARLYGQLGDAYTQLHEGAQAVAAYKQAVALDPNQASHLRTLAQALYDQQKYKEAMGDFQELAQMEPKKAVNHLRLAEIYRHLDQLDKAEKEALLAKQYAPNNLEAIYEAASIYEAEGRYNDAIQLVSGAITAQKNQTDVQPTQRRTLAILYQMQGQLYDDAGNYSAAVHSLQELGALGPEEDRRSRMLIIDTYREARDLPHAFEEAHKAVATYPDDRDLRVKEAMLYGEANQPDRAAAILKPMLQNKPSDVGIYINLAQVYEQGHRYAEANKSLHEAAKVATRAADRETIGFLTGANYEQQKKYAEAEQAFKGVLAINPKNAAALNYYGYMLAEQDVRLGQAVTLVQRALAEDPNNAAYLDSLGWAYFKQHRLSEAEDYLRKAILHDGHDPTILTHLGDVLASDGQPQQAAVEWKKALTEWQRVLPADFEADKVAELQKKLSELKHRVAQQTSPAEAKPR